MTAVMQGVRVLEVAADCGAHVIRIEHVERGDAILAELGLDWNTIVDLKVRGITA
jgi:hypothetical protein